MPANVQVAFEKYRFNFATLQKRKVVLFWYVVLFDVVDVVDVVELTKPSIKSQGWMPSSSMTRVIWKSPRCHHKLTPTNKSQPSAWRKSDAYLTMWIISRSWKPEANSVPNYLETRRWLVKNFTMHSKRRAKNFRVDVREHKSVDVDDIVADVIYMYYMSFIIHNI